ncbi:MAG: ATP-binding cassette subfamily F protein uup [Bradymonadia bacterium]|jgi:ATP-binding cassette subfamily F protein uup
MPLINVRGLRHSFGGAPIFKDAQLTIDAGERVGLVGRNGAGKSTLLKVIAKELAPDAGTLDFEDGCRVARLEQAVPDAMPGSVFEIVAAAWGATGADAALVRAGGEASYEVHDPGAAWEVVPKIEALLSKLSLDPDATFGTLSGGLKRRVVLANALAGQPDLLLLDEPTNHLDIEAVTWLEQFLIQSPLAMVIVTHDREFLARVANRIAEVDQGVLRSWDCDYRTFLVRRDAWIAEQASELARMDKRIAEEDIWSRKNVQARRTKSVARLKALDVLREERATKRSTPKTAKLEISEAARSGKLVIEAEGVSFTWPDGPSIVQNLDIAVLRGDKIGFVGPNGVGKTTLIKLLLKQIEPDAGKIKHGTKLQALYFDQQRDELNPEQTVVDAVAGGAEHVEVNGRQRHIMGYLRDFLFEPERARTRVGLLSGGEQNRLLLARQFLKPANLLILDEPTNDLDAETLELLEDRLADFEGTVLVVSHDRAFLNAVCTNTLAFEDGNVREYVGGYDDWQRARAREAKGSPKKARDAAKVQNTVKAQPTEQPPKPKKLSFNQKRELEELPGLLETLHAEVETLSDRMSDPDLYADLKEAKRVQLRFDAAQAEHETAFERWAELEELRETLEK